MKKILLGIVLGIVIAVPATGIAAAVFTAQLATFEVFVNGKKFVSENPVIVVDGRTYLPLKETGDVLGTKVEWNEKDRRVEVGSLKVAEKDGVTETIVRTVESSGLKISKNAVDRFEMFGTPAIAEQDEKTYIWINILSDYWRTDDDYYYVQIPGNDELKVMECEGRRPVPGVSLAVDLYGIYVDVDKLGISTRIDGDILKIEPK